MAIDQNTIIIYIFGIIVLYILGKMALGPMKIIFKVIANGVIGGTVLAITNYIGGTFGFGIALNIATALTVGFLGIPGYVLLVVLKYLFKI
ncbi:MAG: pro-sigmaK processing inhibitor BofA family protein [Clostridia bacterium]|nr:pro-sigmaK processing inhibitor BofA family protein [Clostridia bacterium]